MCIACVPHPLHPTRPAASSPRRAAHNACAGACETSCIHARLCAGARECVGEPGRHLRHPGVFGCPAEQPDEEGASSCWILTSFSTWKANLVAVRRPSDLRERDREKTSAYLMLLFLLYLYAFAFSTPCGNLLAGSWDYLMTAWALVRCAKLPSEC